MPFNINNYLIVILIIMIGDYLLDLLVDKLNLSRLSPQLPDEFKDSYDSDDYARSQEYTRAGTRFGFVTNTINIILIVPFIMFGGFNWIDQWARGFEHNAIITGLIFTGILTLGTQLLALPFSSYRTFVIEAKFGFNRTTPRTFFLDLLKGMALSVVIGAPILALILWFFQEAGPLAWLYVWSALTMIQILISFIAPVLIMPLFNKFVPLEEGELKERIEAYAQQQKFKMKGIFTIDGSRRSTKSNAFFTGFGKSRRIALYDTLIAKHTVPELVAVLAHEIGHNKLGHIPQGMISGILKTGLMLFILNHLINNPGLFAAFQMSDVSIYASLVFFGFLYSPISMLLGIITTAISRQHEFAADRFAVATTKDPESMVTALKTLSVSNLSNLTPHPLKVFLEYSHPPVLARIRAIKQLH